MRCLSFDLILCFDKICDMLIKYTNHNTPPITEIWGLTEGKVPNLAHAFTHSWLKHLFRWESATLLWSYRELYLTDDAVRWIAENFWTCCLSRNSFFQTAVEFCTSFHILARYLAALSPALTLLVHRSYTVLLRSDRVARKPHHSKAVWSKGVFYVKTVTSNYLSLWKELLTGGEVC